MTKILFVCLGNICRSTMAEFVFRDMAEKRGLGWKYAVSSAGTSDEEEGNPVHPGTKRKLSSVGVAVDPNKRARQMTRADYGKYDLLIGMEARNVADMRRITGGDSEGKMRRLLDYSDSPRNIADPWYTGNFDETYDDIQEGCSALLDALEGTTEI